MLTRIEAKNLVRQLTTDECRELLAKTLSPLSSDASQTYRAIHQVLSDANTDAESKERARIFREELQGELPYLLDDTFNYIGDYLKLK